jgi:SPP1 family predicted phage head-tail adaptor
MVVFKMTFDHELTLLGETIVEDELGNQEVVFTEKTILGAVKSVGRSEFYSAATTGLQPSIIFVIHGYEYDNEQYVRFQNDKYRVIRTYSTDFEEVELTCEKVMVQ